MHECKMKEHTSQLCPRSVVPCVNACYGCELTMERQRLASHVQHCAASVLVCKFPASYEGKSVDGDAELTPTERLASVTRSPCQLLARRDELSGHILTYHLDILHAPLLFKRCPMALYGCHYTQSSLVPGPKGSSVEVASQGLFIRRPESEHSGQLTAAQVERRRKQKELAMYGYAAPETPGSFEQLPAELLVKICSYLDSLGLRNLSQTSYFLRDVCYKLVSTKGITVSTWQRQDSSWVLGPKVWTFTKICSPVQSWLPSDNASMCAHMMSCDWMKSCASKHHCGDVWDTKEHKRVPTHLADFRREENLLGQC